MFPTPIPANVYPRDKDGNTDESKGRPVFLLGIVGVGSDAIAVTQDNEGWIDGLLLSKIAIRSKVAYKITVQEPAGRLARLS